MANRGNHRKPSAAVRTIARVVVAGVAVGAPLALAAAPAQAEPVNWDAVAACESSGNWGANTGNGYYGGLQFNKSTWDSNGGDAYAEYPHQATREQQIAIATKVRDDRGGYSAWPACSRKLGLPT